MKYKIKLLIAVAIMVIVSAKFNSVLGQVTLNSNNQTGVVPNPNEYVGSGNGYNLEFKSGTASLYMKLLTNGKLGLSNPANWLGGFTPNFSFDVDAGDINLHTFTNSYRIGDGSTGNSFRVLWHNGDTSSIYVGVGAGISTTPSSTLNNTLIGNNAGTSIVNAFRNVAIGQGALQNLVNPIGGESENTAVGVRALQHNYAYGGCALGYQAGQNNDYGCSLVAIGEEAAQLSLHGNNNMAIGEAALKHDAYLSENIAIGKTALEWMSFNPGSDDTCVDNGTTDV